MDIKNYIDVKRVFLNENIAKNVDEIRQYEDEALIVIKSFNSIEELIKKNIEIVDITAGHIQDKIKTLKFNDRLRWNLYLVFIVSKKIENEYTSEIQKIESDKYCCKKYILQLEDIKDLNSELVKKIPLFICLKALHKEVSVVNNNLDITKLEISEILKRNITSKNIEEFVSKDYSIADIENFYSEEINIEN